jgi:hypothetical protein
VTFDGKPLDGVFVMHSVVISSADAKALAAIHRFLQFQIQEHKTGDSTAVR